MQVPIVKFRKFPVQPPDKILEGVGEGAWWISGRFRGRYLVRFWGLWCRDRLCEVPEWFWRTRCLASSCEVPEGSGADALWNIKGSDFLWWHDNCILLASALNLYMAWALLMEKAQTFSSCWGKHLRCFFCRSCYLQRVASAPQVGHAISFPGASRKQRINAWEKGIWFGPVFPRRAGFSFVAMWLFAAHGVFGPG